MGTYISNNNFANLRIRQGTRPNILIENYIQPNNNVIWDFGENNNNPLKYTNWYISYSFRKENVPNSPYTPAQKLPKDEDGEAGLGRVRVIKDTYDGAAISSRQYLISDMGYALDLILYPKNAINSSMFRIYYPCLSWPIPPYNNLPWVSPTSTTTVVSYNQGLYTMYYVDPNYTIGQIPLTLSGVAQESYYKEIWAPQTHNNLFLNTKVYNKTDNKNKWETLVVLNNQAIITWKNVYYNGTGTNPDSVYTRMNHQPGWNGVVNYAGSYKINNVLVNALTQPGFFATGLDGPYPDFEVASPGAVSLKIYLFAHDQNGVTIYNSSNPIIATASNITNSEKAAAYKDFSFTVYQQAVAVTRKDSSTGQILTNGINFNNSSIFGQIIAGQTITIDKTSNRGDDLLSTWSFYKLTGTAWEIILPGTGAGINLGGSETLASDTIHVTFTDEGQYKVANSCMGSAGGQENSGWDIHEIYVGINQPLVPEITWPNIISNVIESPLDLDPLISNNPLTGKQPLTIRAEALVDVNSGSWVWVDPDEVLPPTTRILTAAEWRDEIEARCFTYCYVKLNGVLVDTRTGWGPHDIELTEGDYSVQFVSKYKSSILQNQSVLIDNNIIS